MKGVIACGDPQTAEAGAAVLRVGGNAVDAAVAATFASFIAEAPLMPVVGRVAGPILGPRGKMPTPVPPQAPIDAILERERRTIVLRSRDKPFVKCKVGQETMNDDELVSNIESVLSNIINSVKRGKNNIRSIYIKLTMGPAIKLL